MKAKAILAAVLLSIGAGAAAAQDCVDADIAECPTRFFDACQADAAFREANLRACVDILAGVARDADSCPGPETPTCRPVDCSGVFDPIDRHFCEAGRADCPTSIPDILDGYDRVLALLNTALEPYADLTRLNPADIGDVETLCGYSRAELDRLMQLATADRDGLDRYGDDLNALRACSVTLNDFMDGGPPQGIATELWQNIRGGFDASLETLSEREGAVKTQIEELEGTPAKLQSLLLVFRLSCQRSAAPADQ